MSDVVDPLFVCKENPEGTILLSGKGWGEFKFERETHYKVMWPRDGKIFHYDGHVRLSSVLISWRRRMGGNNPSRYIVDLEPGEVYL